MPRSAAQHCQCKQKTLVGRPVEAQSQSRGDRVYAARGCAMPMSTVKAATPELISGHGGSGDPVASVAAAPSMVAATQSNGFGRRRTAARRSNTQPALLNPGSRVAAGAACAPRQHGVEQSVEQLLSACIEQLSAHFQARALPHLPV